MFAPPYQTAYKRPEMLFPYYSFKKASLGHAERIFWYYAIYETSLLNAAYLTDPPPLKSYVLHIMK